MTCIGSLKRRSALDEVRGFGVAVRLRSRKKEASIPRDEF
jgi:hypothetical protein